MTLLRNTALVDNFASDFRRLYEPVHAWGDVINAHLLLPQLRGFWPFSSLDENGNVLDLSNQGRTLTNNSSTPFNTQLLIPYANLDGSSDYFSRADEAGLDITGALSFGGWFWVNNLSSSMGLMSKWNTGQRSYLLQLANSPVGELWARISFDGTSIAGTSNFGPVAANTWVHAVFTGAPDGGDYEIITYLNGEQGGTTSVVGGSALHSGTAAFQVGAYDGGANYLNGRATLCFLCAAQVSEDIASGLFQMARPLFGV